MVRVLAICCLVVLVPRGAVAEWHLTPMVGLTMFGSTPVVDLEHGSGKLHLNLGGTVAWLSRGIFGVEALGTWTPRFFEGEADLADAAPELDSGRAISLMGNVLVTLPQRWTEYGLRPFVSGGIGLMHARAVDSLGIFAVKWDVWGFNVGGGAIGFFSQRTGVRFDVRYHGNLKTREDLPAFAPAQIRYVTASVGLVLRR